VGRFNAAQRLKRDCEFGAVWRQLVLALTLIAFAVQGYITQTHIHLPAAFEATATRTTAGNIEPGPFASSPPGGGSTDDVQSCPFCQEIVFAGQYLSPAAIGVIPPILSVTILPVAEQRLAEPSKASHSWQGRAPPSL
jgi:hypothetical protein